MKAGADHWNQHALQWQWIGSPLRPAAEDVQLAERAVAHWHAMHPARPPEALLLGVTPELVRMAWPAGTQQIALDHSRAMIREIWPGRELGQVAASARWTNLPLRAASCDVISGDGCFSNLAFPGEYDALVSEMQRVLRADGLVLMRFFVRPGQREPLQAVLADLRGNRIANFHVFKWRLAMALHGTLREGVRLADIWDAFNAAFPDPGQVAALSQWPLPVVLTINNYRGVQTRYTFPTLAEVRAAFAPAFAEIECTFPAYPLGERCPTLAFQPHSL